MINNHSQEIELRATTIEDIAELTQLANNKKVWNNLKNYIPFPYTAKDAEYFIRLTMNENPRLTFAINYHGKLAGVIGLVPLKDIYCKTAEIGYWIGEPYWNKNIASQAVQVMTLYAFEDLHFCRLQAGVFEYNIASMRVLEKNHYIKEGVFKKSVWKNEQFWNEHKYAIIAK